MSISGPKYTWPLGAELHEQMSRSGAPQSEARTLVLKSPSKPARSNSWDGQLAVPNDPRYARLETSLEIGQSKEE
ncbi:hypothetical protein TNCV_3537401 [Trichonephila clavipes]|nr:hypothetical protein TNCV_3537401 [Trichonephila clavipes]